MRRNARIDKNHPEIVEAFRKLGASVLSLAPLGRGIPDLLVAIGGVTWLIEIKSKKGKENDLQIEWAKTWKGKRDVVRDTKGVETVIKMMRST